MGQPGMKIFTRTGDDGTTGLLYGGRVGKDDPIAAAVGDVDEAQAAMGVARAQAAAQAAADGSAALTDLGTMLVARQRDLWVVMAELATAAANRHKLTPGETLVTSAMVDVLEGVIADLSTCFEPIREFVVPGQNEVAAALDLARAVVRRAERSTVAALNAGAITGSHAVAYLNRLSALLWAAARAHEGQPLITRETENPTSAI